MTSMRRFEAAGGSVFRFLEAVSRSIEKCGIRSPSTASRPSSFTTARLDSTREVPPKLEIAKITKKRGSNRSEADDLRLIELECQNSLYLDGDGKPTIPAAALRSMIEKAARKLKQGPQVREGLIVESVDSFEYDVKRYGKTVEQIGKSAQFTVPVVVQRARILRTRAMFELPWSITATLDVDDELVDKTQLESWLDIGGRRIGLCDWRPEKSGQYGRFDVKKISALK